MKSKIPITEVFLSFVSIWWAVVLFVSADFSTSRIPEHLELIYEMGEVAWAFVFLAAAFTKFIGLLTMKCWVRKLGLVMSMVLYSIISSGYILSNNLFHTGTGVYFLMTVLAWWGFREVTQYDEPVERSAN